ncbi:major facilitator superfamily MFS-1 [Apiospora hydei]|uniref:Major facilitator superfamily MFS-1 n=1 Tax=Apiospora hydei TaxID=1337664 RepID=A0ABR1WMI5_9PEZI
MNIPSAIQSATPGLLSGADTACAPDGPIALGNIISDPRSPEIAINFSTPATTSALGNLVVHEAVELDQTRTLDNSNNVQPSVWAKFLSGLVPGLGDIGGEAGVRAASGSTSSYSFEKIVTREIFPDLETVRTAFGDEQVQQSIKKRHWQLSVFMITGVQIAYGAEVLLNRARERGVYFQTGVDLTAATGGVAPVSVGAGLDTSSTSSQSLSTKYQSPLSSRTGCGRSCTGGRRWRSSGMIPGGTSSGFETRMGIRVLAPTMAGSTRSNSAVWIKRTKMFRRYSIFARRILQLRRGILANRISAVRGC